MNEQNVDVSRELAESALTGWQALFNWIGSTPVTLTVEDLDDITHLRRHIEGWLNGAEVDKDPIAKAEDSLKALGGVTQMLLIDMTCEDFLLHDTQSDGVSVLLNGLIGELRKNLEEITDQVIVDDAPDVTRKAA